MAFSTLIGQLWYVKVKGEKAVRTVKITDETNKTIAWTETVKGLRQVQSRFLRTDINLVERVER